MAKPMRDVVREGYNKGDYQDVFKRNNAFNDNFEKLMCEELNSRLKLNSKILDMGCGPGVPYDKYFADEGHYVTGIDISEKHIDMAIKNVNNARFIVGDFFSNDAKGKYDAIISLYAIFHIPRTEHKKLLNHINSMLKKNGLILITLGAYDMKRDVSDDFAGAPMAWSSYTVEKNKKIVMDAGFDIMMAVEDYRIEKHLWILAVKK
jgi:2-polyprenyl-3-methyl-5-hydroxy-6-metoxy-1,4-benzoquinol methylase